MKKRIPNKVLALIMTMAIIAGSFGTISFASTPVDFSFNPSLGVAAGREIGMPVDQITTADLMRVSHLYFEANSLNSLEGVEMFPNLTSIFLNGNEVDDLTPLMNVPRFSRIDIQGNSLTSLSELSWVDENVIILNFGTYGTYSEMVEIEAKVNQILSTIIFDGMTDTDKILAVHDWVIRNMVYSDFVPNYDYTSVAMFDYGAGLCGTYSYGAVGLLNYLDIEAFYLQGDAGGSHAWVGAEVDGKVFNMDTLWDDDCGDSSKIKYDYFLIDNTTMVSHDPGRTFYAYPSINQALTIDNDTTFAAVGAVLNNYQTFADFNKRVATGGNLFYVKASDSDKLHMMAFNGTSDVVVVDSATSDVRVGDNKVYYTTNGTVYSMNVDGTNQAESAYPVVDNGSGATLTFADAKVEASVRALTNVYGRDIKESDVTEVRHIQMATGVTSLVGLENLHSLASINAQSGTFTDLTPLAELTDLECINFNYGDIVDVSPLTNLTKLNEIRLHGNIITDVSPLAGLTPIILSIGNNPFTDISAFAGHAPIMSFSMTGSSVASLLPLKNVGITVLMVWGFVTNTTNGNNKIFDAEEAVLVAETTHQQEDVDFALAKIALVTANANSLKTRALAIDVLTPLEAATAAVEAFEQAHDLAYLDAAVFTTGALEDSAEKTALNERIDIALDETIVIIATDKVVIAESAKTQSAINDAFALVNDITINLAEHESLTARLDVIQAYVDAEVAYVTLLNTAVTAVQNAVSTKTQEDVDNARVLVAELRADDKTEQTTLLDAVQAVIDAQIAEEEAAEAAYALLLAGAEAAVANAESAKTVETVITAEALVDELNAEDQGVFTNRLDTVRAEIIAEEAYAEELSIATTAVQTAVDSEDQDDVDTARALVSDLRNEDKDAMNETLDAVQILIDARIAEEEAYALQLAEAEVAVANAESAKTVETVITAEALVNELNAEDQGVFTNRLDDVRAYIIAEEAYAEELAIATTAVQTAVDSEDQDDVDTARTLVSDLRNADKTAMNDTLDAVQAIIDAREASAAYALKLAEVELAVANAESLATLDAVISAEALIDELNPEDQETFTSRIQIVRTNIQKAIDLAQATTAVEQAEALLTQAKIDTAITKIAILDASEEKDALADRLTVVQTIVDEATYQTQLANAIAKVVLAESTKTQASINTATTLVNALTRNDEKATLLARLDAIEVIVVIVPPVVEEEPDIPTPPVTQNPIPEPMPLPALPILPIATGETYTTTNGINSVLLAVSKSMISEQLTQTPVGETPTIEFNVEKKDSTQATVSFSSSDITTVQGSNMNIKVNYENVSYILPTSELNFTDIREQLGVNSTVNPEIEVLIRQTTEAEAFSLIKNDVTSTYTLIAQPTIFEVRATANGISVNLDTFTSYVERIIALPAGVTASMVTTGVVINPDGSISPVPTEFYTENGITYAKIKSMTNSAYTVIANIVSVSSVAKHWSKATVNELASKLIIDNPTTFDPNKAINRGDFIIYLLKGLGLYRSGLTDTAIIFDKGSKPYADAITVAVARGILTGYGNNSYGANDTITREQAMVITARAMKVVGLKSINPARVKTFPDFNKANTWAITGITDTVGSGIINGSNGKLNLQSTITYAEAATITRNLMVQSGLLKK